ncbi:hypothetical protein [Mycobacterium sp. 050134]|uniref:hypothetical protein n=1 Tax=Mycobacterium sp. 050134 TaxID=3096111 RepID=UPI002ED9654B
MLQRDPRPAARRARLRLATWWRRGPSRLRLRRRLVVYSLPPALVLLIGVGKIVSTMLTGNAAVSDFAQHDIDALRSDVSTLSGLNIIEPGKVSFVAGDLEVLEGNLDTAERQFGAALDRSGGADACAVRVNLELVRETQGDIAAANGDKSRAEERYNSALQVISGAPPHCYRDNADPNPDRRRIRNDAAARLADKIKALHLPPTAPPPSQTMTPPPPPPTSLTKTNLPPPPAPGATSTPEPPPPPPGPGGPVFGPNGGGGNGEPGGRDGLKDVSPDRIPVTGNGSVPGHRLGTGEGGSPLDQLQQALGDADSTGPSGQGAVEGAHA